MPRKCQVIETESRFKVIRGQGFGDGELLLNRSWIFNLKWYKHPGNGQGWCVYYEWASCSKVIKILSWWYVYSHKHVYHHSRGELDSIHWYKNCPFRVHYELFPCWHEEGGAGESSVGENACSVSIKTGLENSSTDFNLLGISTHAMVCEETGGSGACWPSA